MYVHVQPTQKYQATGQQSNKQYYHLMCYFSYLQLQYATTQGLSISKLSTNVNQTQTCSIRRFLKDYLRMIFWYQISVINVLFNFIFPIKKSLFSHAKAVGFQSESIQIILARVCGQFHRRISGQKFEEQTSILFLS